MVKTKHGIYNDKILSLIFKNKNLKTASFIL